MLPRNAPAITLFLVTCLLAPSILRADDETGLYHKVSAACFETMVDGRLGGSGWFSAESGWGFTACHVVKSADTKLQVRTRDHAWKATLHAVDLAHDIALLRIDGQTPAGLPMAAAFPPVGGEIRLHGTPVFRHRVWLPGRVAGPAPTYEFLGHEEMAIRCFHVAGFAPKGTSGGPWVNAGGEVVGLQSGGMVDNNAPLGITFVTPAGALAAILETKQHAATPTFGVAAEEIVEQSVEWISALPEGQGGIVLKRVRNDGPLGTAGAKDQDLVLSINGQSLTTRDEFYRTLYQLEPGQPAKVILRTHEGDTRTLDVTPAIQEDRFQAIPAPPGKDAPSAG